MNNAFNVAYDSKFMIIKYDHRINFKVLIEFSSSSVSANVLFYSNGIPALLEVSIEVCSHSCELIILFIYNNFYILNIIYGCMAQKMIVKFVCPFWFFFTVDKIVNKTFL